VTELTTRRIWLVGSMGSGKTVVGRALEHQLGWPLLDNDLELEATEGRSLTDLAEDGPEALHRRESAQLHRAVATTAPFVAGVAASVGDRPVDLELLAETGSVVYLRATVETLVARLGRGEGRPWLDDDPASWLAATLARREPGYLSVADVVVDVDRRTPDEVARAIVERLVASVGAGSVVAEADDTREAEESG
jgi:shikimate kinase